MTALDRRFWHTYLVKAAGYTPYFFCNAPVWLWWDFFGSTHRVATALTLASLEIESQPDIWNRSATARRMLRDAKARGTIRLNLCNTLTKN